MCPRRSVLCLLLLACYFLPEIQGSKVIFGTSPTRVIDGLTPSLDLECDLVNTAPSAGVVGRRDVTLERRDVTLTADNMASVTSLVIMQGGRDVASVSTTVAAHVMDGSANAQVTGSVTSGSTKQGFLHITFKNPTVNQTDEYTCEVNAVSTSGHVVTFTSSVEVTTSAPTIADLVTYVRELNDKNEILEQTVAQLQHDRDTMVFFNARLSTVKNVIKNQVIVFDKVIDNEGNDYSATSGLFVCEVPGYYDFSVGCLAEPNSDLALDVYRNNTSFFALYSGKTTVHASGTNSAAIKLVKGDVIKVVAMNVQSLHDYFCSFSGHLVAPA